MHRFFTISLLFCLIQSLSAQMQIGNDILYGNEWIDYTKPHIKIKVADDGLWRIPYQTLLNAAWPVNAVQANRLRLFRNGVQVPVYLNFTGVMSANSYIEFYGQKNRSELDAYLWDQGKDGRVNTDYSMFNDTAAYFLTWSEVGTPLRITDIPNDILNAPNPEEWAWSTAKDVVPTFFVKGRESDYVYNSWFNYEGFASTASAYHSRNISLPGLYSINQAAHIELRYLSQWLDHDVQVTVNDSLIDQQIFSGSAVKIIDKNLPTSKLSATTKVEVRGLATSDNPYLGTIHIRYPRRPDASNSSFLELETQAGSGPKYFEIVKMNIAGGEILVYNLSTNQRVTSEIDGDTVKFLLPSANISQRILLINTSLKLKEVASAQNIQFINYLNTPASYLFITHPKMRQAALGLDPVQEFANYRGSNAGGNFVPLIVDINQLYDQYAYGIDFHPFSVRNFTHKYKAVNPGAEYLMLVGKGIEYSKFRTTVQQNSLKDSLYFVPTYGSPATDLMFVMGNGISKPIMNIGRLATVSADEVFHYLNKVKQYENTQKTAGQTLNDKAWMKRVLHLNGGLIDDTPTLRVILNGFENRLRTNKYGADIYTVEKRSNDPVLLTGYDQVQNYFRDGISLMTFMGHSGSEILSFDLGQPSLYPTSGKYPVFAVMGCYSGACTNASRGIGEEFVLAPNRCAIAYFASVSYGITSSLNVFGLEYYRQIGGEGYNKSQGEVLANVIDSLKNSTSADMIGFLHQFQYQGDPAIKLNHQEGPDYMVDPKSFNPIPNPVSVEEPNFNLNFDIVNIGYHVDSTIAVKIMQQLPNDTARLVLIDTIPTPPYRSSLSYTLASPGEKGVGFNRFFVQVDATNQVAELPAVAETNNDLIDGVGAIGTDVYFYSNDAKPIWPKEYSIVSEDSLTLFSSTLSSTSPLQTYLIQIDTTPSFSSNLLSSTSIQSKAGLITWKPNINLIDSTVYFWRIARDTLIINTLPWRMSSFTYIKGSPSGWNQSHHKQMSYNTLQTMSINDTLRQIEFADNLSYFWLEVGWRGLGTVYQGFQNHLDQNFLGDYGWGERLTYQGLLIAVVNPVTGEYVPNPIGYPNNPSPTYPLVYRLYDTRDSLPRIAAMQYLKDSIPDGHYVNVFMMSQRPVNPSLDYDPEEWANDSVSYGTNLFQIFEAQGAKRIRELQTLGSVPYGIVYKHNTPAEPVLESIVTSTTTTEQLRKTFLSKWDKGKMKSVLIGPASKWQSALWSAGLADHPLDEYDVEIFKVKEGQSDVSVAILDKNTAVFDLSQVNATEYPYLRLVYRALDTIENTATNLPMWRVLYDGVPEAAITPNEYLAFQKDTVNQGEAINISLSFRNISDYPMDSILVQMRTEDNSGLTQTIEQRLKILPSGDSLIAHGQFDTKKLSGPQRLIVDYNYQNDQLELYHFNNVYLRQFYVQGDRINPALDVTFDGRRILNGDLVSPKPEISIVFSDENKYLAMSDTNLFRLFLTYPNGTEQLISMSDPNLMFIPADLSSGKNRATIEYRPYLTEDGDYSLRVNGRDASGNLSAGLDFKVKFRVINKSSLSHILNYPNPFSTSTCFFYTLTGLEAPSQIKVRIMTVSGRVVREVTETEFGEMQIGTHLSNFCWDGKDAFGDQLANGVYYYQVFAKKANGEPFDLFENTQTDGYFKNGIGKMVLLR
jgi:hypothetical protein